MSATWRQRRYAYRKPKVNSDLDALRKRRERRQWRQMLRVRMPRFVVR